MNSFKMIFVSSLRVRGKFWFRILSAVSAVTKGVVGMLFVLILSTGFPSCASDGKVDDDGDKDNTGGKDNDGDGGNEDRGSTNELLLASFRLELPTTTSREITLNARIENLLDQTQKVKVSFYRSLNAVVTKQDTMIAGPVPATLLARQPGQTATIVTSSYTVPTGDTRYSYGYCVETSSGDNACAKSNVPLSGVTLSKTKLDETCPTTVYSQATTQIDSTTPISYALTFNRRWSSGTHPTNYPSGRNPHFTTLVGASHNDSVVFWQRGEFASAGVEIVAEDGATGTFLREISAQGTNAVAATGTTLTVSQAHPLITMISMLAPSPDWFIGIGGFDMKVNGSTDTFYDEVTIPLRLYDAGTESSEKFSRSSGEDTGVNADMSLRERITRLSTGEEDTDFGNNNNLEGTPCVGTFTIKKQ